MTTTMTCGVDELPALVASQAAHVRAADSERRKLGDELAIFRVRERWEATVPGADGVRRIVERAVAIEEIRALGQATATLTRALFIGIVKSPPAVVFASSDDSGVNAGAVLKEALASHSGRGGGSPRAAQGTVPDSSALDTIVETLSHHRID